MYFECFTSSSLSSSNLLKHVSEYQNANESTSNSKLHAPRHSALPFSSLLEAISDEDEEILVSSLSRRNGTHPLIHPFRSVQIELAIVPDIVTIEPISVHQTLATCEPPQSRHTCRSLSSRTRRNYRCNTVKRLYRDRHCILRLVYHRFKL
ncbi:unnamed protein product [Rotaria magnacalcarata]|uniref:Uncharacterized protein n=1 Tax=Rotaria magnacalcarata TaxID=392030 RepID=A0A816V8K5_9BILA|nr:unnamed protein product [Rotaria magnacalcarata]CAF2120777.1 unnamed protein product [Rotaria magnacalcarata]CAF4160336.1 unnamed protein product [Rotaria magnacalcarata]CAF4185366.1 unnamed protein product [Rotaria magnacalcarata]